MKDVESGLTDRYQTKRDRIRYALRANGEVVLQRVSPGSVDDDPALAPFLALLEQDIAGAPERLQPITSDLVQRRQTLVGNVDMDLDAPLPDEGDTPS